RVIDLTIAAVLTIDRSIARLPDYPIIQSLDEREPVLAEIPPEEARRIGPQPVVEDLGVDRSEVGFEADIRRAVFERRVLRIGRQVRGRAVEPAVDLAA